MLFRSQHSQIFYVPVRQDVPDPSHGKNYNNFPKLSENPVCHVRPHARNSKDTYELPDGRKYPKQCFWLNNSYILSQLDKKFIGD